MKHKFLLKAMLLLCALIAGSSSVWAGTYTYDIASNGANGFYTDSELTTHPGYSSSNKISSFYASDGKLFTASAENIYFSATSNGYLFVTGGVTLTLPTYSGEKITNITLYNSSGCSTSVKVSIVSGSNTASAQQTWSTQGSNYSYNITSTYQSSTLGIAVASGKNAQITKIVITTESIGDVPSATVSTASLDFGKVDFGYSKDLTFTVTPANLTGNLTIASNNAKYTVSPTSIAQSTTTATTITVTAAPTAIDNDMDGTITISGGGLSENKTVSLSCTVTDPSKNNGTLERPYTVADVNDGTASGSDVYVVGYIVGEFDAKDKDAKTSGFGGTNLALSDSPSEISGENTIPVQLPSGSLRTAWNLNNNNVIGYKVRIRGTLAGYFTGKTGIKPPTEVTALTIPVTIASSGYSTIAKNLGLDFSNALPAGLEAYVASALSASAVTLTDIDEAPASTGVILKGAKNTVYTIPVKSDAAAVGTNYLKAAVTATSCAANEVYILKDGLFHKVTGASTVPAGKAYLLAEDVPAAAPELMFVFSETTGVNTLNVERETLNGEFYNLAGQRVAQPSKGLYIVNGKKVVIK